MAKVLLLGLGRWGINHLRVLHSLPVELFVVDSQPDQLKAARSLGISDSHISTTHKDFIKRIDAAVIVTPAQSHFCLCQEFLTAGKDVFVEKPITLVSSEAKELAELSDKTGRILQVGHIFRYDPASMWLRQAIQTGQFGKLQILRGNFSGFKRPRNDSGVAFADAIHFIDLFNFFLGVCPKKVRAVLKDFLSRGMDDAAFISLEYETPQGPAWGMVETNYFLPGKFREVVLVGDALSAVCDYNVSQYKIKTYENKHIKAGLDIKAQEGALHQIECAPEEPLMAEMRAFLSSLETRTTPRANAWAGYDSVRVLEAVLESGRTGNTVSIPS
jgi:UDP-N-acetylglucosamine 3-dehydrogenase